MTPRDRVAAFLSDFEAAHATFRRESPNQVDFVRWGELVAELDDKHFVGGEGRQFAHSFGTQLPHGPSVETITSVREEDERVVVETECAGFVKQYYEYELVEVGAQWRIARLVLFFDGAEEPFVGGNARATFEDPPSVPLRDVAANVEVNGDRLFEQGRSVALAGESYTVEVRELGSIVIASGVLVVGDLGYDAGVLQPLAVRVPPGAYPVHAAIAAARTCALRIVLSSAPVVSWHCADGPGAGHVMGVDAGNLAVLDARSVVEMTARTKARCFDAWTRMPDRPSARILSLWREHDAVIADSGWGDGAYPIYWGMDERGVPVVLLIDFLVLGEGVETVVELAASDDLHAPELAAAGMQVSFQSDARGLSLIVEGTLEADVELLNADGEVLARSGAAERREVSGPVCTYAWEHAWWQAEVARLRITLPDGYRN